MKENGGSDAVLDQVRLYIVHRCQSHYIGNGDKKKSSSEKEKFVQISSVRRKMGTPNGVSGKLLALKLMV